MKQVQIRLTDEERIDTIYQQSPGTLPLSPLLALLLRRIPNEMTCQDAKSKTEPAISSMTKSQENESQSIQAFPSTFKQGRNAAPSRVTARFRGNFRGHKKSA